MRVLQSMHQSPTNSQEAIGSQEQVVRSFISIKEIKRMVSESSKHGANQSGTDSNLFNSLSESRMQPGHIRQKSAMNSSRSSKQKQSSYAAIVNLIDEEKDQHDSNNGSVIHLQNPQFIKRHGSPIKDQDQLIQSKSEIYRNFLENDSARFDSSDFEVRQSLGADTRGYFPKEYLQQSESEDQRLSLYPESASSLLDKYQKSLRIHTQIDDNFQIQSSLDKIEIDLMENDDFFEKIDKLKRQGSFQNSLLDSQTDTQKNLHSQNTKSQDLSIKVIRAPKKQQNLQRPNTQLATVKASQKTSMDQIDTERHQDNQTSKLKTDVRLLKELLREEKLRNQRLQNSLQKEKLKQQLVDSPTYQAEHLRLKLESEYHELIEQLQTEIKRLRNDLIQQRYLYEDQINILCTQVKKLQNENKLLVQNQLQNQFDSVTSVVETKLPQSFDKRTKMQLLKENNDTQGPKQTYRTTLKTNPSLLTQSLQLSSDESENGKELSQYLTQKENIQMNSHSSVIQDKTASQKKRVNQLKSQLDQFNVLSRDCNKKSNKNQKMTEDSCDVSQSYCEDSIIQEESGIAQKIKSVNIHSNIPLPHQLQAKSVLLQPENNQNNLKMQLSGLIQQIDGLLLPKVQLKSMQDYRGVPMYPRDPNQQQQYLQTFGGNRNSIPRCMSQSEQSLSRMMDQAAISDRFSFGGYQLGCDDQLLMTSQSIPDDLGESLKRFQLQLEELINRKK